MASDFKHYQLHSNASQIARCSSACKSEFQTNCKTSSIHTDIIKNDLWSVKLCGCQMPFRIKFFVKGNNKSESSN